MPLDVLLFLGCICVVVIELRVLWIVFGCGIVFRLSLCGCQRNEGFVDCLWMSCFFVVFVWLPMKSWFCGFSFDVVLFLGCLCVVANEMRVLWIAFGCVVFWLYLCGCQ